jgi:hypothetical protein
MDIINPILLEHMSPMEQLSTLGEKVGSNKIFFLYFFPFFWLILEEQHSS